MTASKPSVGCAGAGLLGAAIMERLLQQGFPVHAWNRSEDKLAPLLERGATAATTPGELARGSDVVLTCLTDTAPHTRRRRPDGQAGRVVPVCARVRSVSPSG